MKKATYETIRTALTNYGYDNQEVMDELTAEINRGQAQRDANAKAYEALHDIIMDNLSSKACTVAELWDIIQDDVPEGTTKGKVQYALTHLWQDEIARVEGKPNGYRKA